MPDRKPPKVPGRKAKLPARCSLNLSRHFPVWVKLWVTPPDPLFDPHYFQRKQNRNSRNPAISGVSWSCYPDLNWRPHPYQRRRKNFFNHKHHKTKNFRRAIQLLRCQEIATGGPGPLFFHALQQFPAPDLIPMPRRAYKRGNPHGPTSQGFERPSAGDCTERTHLWPRPAPRHRQPPACPFVAGHPFPSHTQTSLKNEKTACMMLSYGVK